MLKALARSLFRSAAVVTVLAAAVAMPAHADLLDTIKQRGQVTVATEARFAPFEFVENGKIVGFGADLLAEIMAKLPGVRVEQLDLPWQGILPGLAAGKFDFVVTSVTVTKERAERYAFTVPFAEATVALVVRKGGPVAKPGDIAGKVVGSQAGSGQLQALRDYDARLKREGGRGVGEIKEYVDFDQAYADLVAGRIQAVAQSLPNLAPLVKQRGDVFAILQPTIGPVTYFAWAGRKDADSASLVRFFSDGLAELNRSGRMAELQRKWFGFTMDVPADKLPEPTM